ncbi:MAG: DUF4147 domain-containing protein [Phycisphaeraceae bacterium]|nr:MAG: DUF4147 domain-containing protein [Phycisphaeraceae bacterium]
MLVVRQHLATVIRAAVDAADPGRAVLDAWPEELDHAPPRSVDILAFGKASVGMAAAAGRRLGPALEGGRVLAVPERIGAAALNPSLKTFRADHPLPTPRTLAAAESVERWLRDTPDDAARRTLLCLISGGGSAHLTLPRDPLTIDDVAGVTRTLQNAGATVHELNTVRRHIERLKGGRLALVAPHRRIVALVISDVEGDDPGTIASGPLTPDPTTPADALRVLDAHGAADAAPAVTEFLRDAAAHPPAGGGAGGPSDPSRVVYRVILNNRAIIDRAARAAEGLGYQTKVLSGWIKGESKAAGERFARLALEHAEQGPLCLLAGGEPTVNIGASTGAGGPSTEFALASAFVIAGRADVTIAALSTDGVDGPPHPSDGPAGPPAGAIADRATVGRAEALQADAAGALARHDSRAAFRPLSDLIITGPTGTNVNHLFLAMIEPGHEGPRRGDAVA